MLACVRVNVVKVTRDRKKIVIKDKSLQLILKIINVHWKNAMLPITFKDVNKTK